jgi:RNA polymerase sigma factor (sigma-70 family)
VAADATPRGWPVPSGRENDHDHKGAQRRGTSRHRTALGYGGISLGTARRGGPANRGPWASTRTGADPVRDNPMVIDLVTRAAQGDKHAWDALVERFIPLIWSICRRHRLGDADSEDVGQTVWLQLVDQLDRIRDPAALPGWLATTTRRECLRLLSAARGPVAGYVMDAEIIADEQARTAEQELLAAERHAALREAFADLPPSGQRLIVLLLEDPPVRYAEISARLGIPVGSIGAYPPPLPGQDAPPSGHRCPDRYGHNCGG